MKKHTKTFLNLALIFFLTGFVLYFSLKDNYQEILKHIFEIHTIYLFGAFLCLFGYYFFRMLSLHAMITEFKPEYTKKRTFRLVLITQFFNAITPFSSGGQPFQVYHLKKDGVSITHGTNIVMQNFIVYQIALVLLGLLALLYNSFFHVFKEIPILKNLVTIGFCINTLVIVSLFFLAFSQKFSGFLLKILTKLWKKKADKIKKWDTYVQNFHQGAKQLFKNKKKLFQNIGANFLGLICLYLVPYMILYGMGNHDLTVITCIVCSAYTMIIGAFVPIPGATGGLEYGYMSFFGQIVKGTVLNASMLLWRAITYYFGLIVGAITLSIKRK